MDFTAERRVHSQYLTSDVQVFYFNPKSRKHVISKLAAFRLVKCNASSTKVELESTPAEPPQVPIRTNGFHVQPFTILRNFHSLRYEELCVIL